MIKKLKKWNKDLDDIKNNVPKIFRFIRTELGIRQGQMAHQLNITSTYIRYIENGKGRASYNIIKRALNLIENRKANNFLLNRRKLGLSQKEMAKRLNISLSELAEIELGSRIPDPIVLEAYD